MGGSIRTGAFRVVASPGEKSRRYIVSSSSSTRFRVAHSGGRGSVILLASSMNSRLFRYRLSPALPSSIAAANGQNHGTLCSCRATCGLAREWSDSGALIHGESTRDGQGPVTYVFSGRAELA